MLRGEPPDPALTLAITLAERDEGVDAEEEAHDPDSDDEVDEDDHVEPSPQAASYAAAFVDAHAVSKSGRKRTANLPFDLRHG